MYFWNVNELVQRLKNNTLSSYEEAQQYFAVLLFGGFGIIGYQLFNLTITSITPAISQFITLFLALLASLLFVLCINIFILACGTIYCYRINKNGDNKDFTKRMICLTFPISLRWFVFAIIALIILYWPTHQLFNYLNPTALSFRLQISGYYNLGTTTLESLINACATTIYVVTYYWYMGKQMYKISH